MKHKNLAPKEPDDNDSYFKSILTARTQSLTVPYNKKITQKNGP